LETASGTWPEVGEGSGTGMRRDECWRDPETWKTKKAGARRSWETRVGA